MKYLLVNILKKKQKIQDFYHRKKMRPFKILETITLGVHDYLEYLRDKRISSSHMSVAEISLDVLSTPLFLKIYDASMEK